MVEAVNMKKLLSIVTLSALVLAACAGDKSEENASEAKNTLEEIQADGEIEIGLEGTFPPFGVHDESGALTGFEYESAEQIAKDLGVEAEYVETTWDSLGTGLDTVR